jgi:hypothetical protein
MVALLKKTLAFASGLVSAWFNILPEIVICAKQPNGNKKLKKIKTFNMFGLVLFAGLSIKLSIYLTNQQPYSNLLYSIPVHLSPYISIFINALNNYFIGASPIRIVIFKRGISIFIGNQFGFPVYGRT